MDLPDLNQLNWPAIIRHWNDNYNDKKPCFGLNTNVCVAEGCYNEACLKKAKK